MTVPLLWDEAVGRLRSRVTPQNFDMWLRPIELLSFDGAILLLRAPNSYVRLWFESNFLSTLLKEIHDLGHDVRVEFDADAPDERPPPLIDLFPGALGHAASAAIAPPPAPAPVIKVVDHEA